MIGGAGATTLRSDWGLRRCRRPIADCLAGRPADCLHHFGAPRPGVSGAGAARRTRPCPMSGITRAGPGGRTRSSPTSPGRRLEATLQENASLLDRLREANVLGVMVSSEEGPMTPTTRSWASSATATRTWRSGGCPTGRSPPLSGPTATGMLGATARQGGVPAVREGVPAPGRPPGAGAGGAALNGDPLRWVTFVVYLSARQRAEQERARLWPGNRPPRPLSQVSQDWSTGRCSRRLLVTNSHCVCSLRERASGSDYVEKSRPWPWGPE